MLVTRLAFVLVFVWADELAFNYEYRLPTHLTPITYHLNLTFSSFSEEISGQVEVQFQVETSTKFVELHADPLFIRIQRASLNNRLLRETRDLDLPEISPVTQTVRFDVGEKLIEKHVYYLTVTYKTQYSFDHRGLIRRQDPVRGQNVQLMSGVCSRRLFPCLDEPHWRSSFKLRLQLHGEYAAPEMIALSCSEGKRIVQSENSSTWTFVATPPIPTYLFTIAVGRFRSFCKTSRLIESEICIWRFAYWKNWESTAEVVVNAAAQFHNEMSAYLLSDPGCRFHFLIVPSKLKGMENFGLLNIRENLWPDLNHPSTLAEFARTLCHEMTHNWLSSKIENAAKRPSFQISSWSHIWLSESIATYLSSIKPIEVDVRYDRSIEPLVSPKWAAAIPQHSYTKGAALVQMLEEIIGQNQMRRLLRVYLRRHQFGHASTSDFMDILDSLAARKNTTFNSREKWIDESSNGTDYSTDAVPPSDFLRAWLTQGSYPIVVVNYDKSVQQFILTQTAKLQSRSHQLQRTQWPIPIWIGCVAGTVDEQLHWLVPGKQLILRLERLTSTNDFNAVSFNRNHQHVYYEVSFRY